MTFDLTFFLLAVPAVLFAGISKGGFGSGAAFAATPLLALVIPPELAVGIMLPLLMLMDIGSLKPYWQEWSWPDARLLILGGLPGVALGGLFWRIADADLLRLLIGLIALGFVAFQTARARNLIRMADSPVSTRFGLIAGVAAGFTSFISHAGGPPAAIYLLARRLTKTEYQATTVITFWAINIMKALPYAFLGIFSAQSLLAGVYLAPAAFLGVWIGVKAHRMIPERAYFAITYALLTITGAKLVFDSLA